MTTTECQYTNLCWIVMRLKVHPLQPQVEAEMRAALEAEYRQLFPHRKRVNLSLLPRPYRDTIQARYQAIFNVRRQRRAALIEALEARLDDLAANLELAPLLGQGLQALCYSHSVCLGRVSDAEQRAEAELEVMACVLQEAGFVATVSRASGNGDGAAVYRLVTNAVEWQWDALRRQAAEK